MEAEERPSITRMRNTQPMSDQDEVKKRRKRRRGRRGRWHLGVWMVLALSLLGLFLGLASMSLTGRVIALPQSATDTVTDRINARLGNAGISLGRVEIGVTPEGRPSLRLVNVGVKDGTGLEVAQLNSVEGGVKFWSLLKGQVEPSTLFLSGAQVTVRRRANGEFDLSFGQASGASGDLASVLDAVDGVFAAGPLQNADRIEAEQLTITLEDARSGRLWQVTDGTLNLTQTDKIVDIAVSFDVFNQTEELAETILGFRMAKDSSEASLGASFTNARAADIAAQSPILAFLSLVDAPISGALRAAIDADGKTSDLAGTLLFGAGALSPAPGAPPVKFDNGRVYMDYDPDQGRVNFAEISVTSELGTARGEGYSYLRDYVSGWPTAMVGQYQISSAQLNPRDWFAQPIELDKGAVDFRLRLDPFTLDLGQVAAVYAGNTYTGSGHISANSEGWSVAVDAYADRLTRDQVLALWPLELAAKPRNWVDQNVYAGVVSDARLSFRSVPGQANRVSIGAAISEATVRPVAAMVPIERVSGYMSIEDQTFSVVAESGQATAPSGHQLSVTGTSFTIPKMNTRPTPAWVDLRVAGEIPGALSLLDAKPFDIFRATDSLGPDLATGRAVARGRLDLALKPQMKPEDIQFDVRADLTGLRADRLIPDHVLAAERAQVHATNAGVEITGDGRVGAVEAGGTWSMAMGPDVQGKGSKVEGWVELSQRFLDEFNVGLPEGTVSGRGTGRYVLDLPVDGAPTIELSSDLNRMTLAAGPLGWRKAANRTGRLLARGVLGDQPRIDRLEFEAPGLSATGRVTLREDGELDAASFDRVRLGGWLDAPVTFQGRGANQAVAIVIDGGSADMRRAEFSSGDGGGGSGDTPISLRLDRLTISEGIVLVGFNGDFNRRGGLNGTFNATVKGGAPIHGTLAPQPEGSAFRITSSDAGGVLRGAGVFETARGGDMTLILAPRAGEGVYEGDLEIKNARVKDAPAMADLLSAISIVGLLEQLSGDGIVFSDVDARFRLDPKKVTLYRSSAVGPSLGISLDGYYDLTNSQMDMQGVLSPLYLVNVVGRVIARKGEGLVGFNFTLKGSPDDPKVGVNPLSIFTPGMFRDIFRRPPPAQQN